MVLIYSQTIVNFPQNLELVGVNCNRVKAVLFEEPPDAKMLSFYGVFL